MINVKLLQLCTETLFDYAESMFTLCCAFAVHLAPFYEKTSHYMDTFITGKLGPFTDTVFDTGDVLTHIQYKAMLPGERAATF